MNVKDFMPCYREMVPDWMKFCWRRKSFRGVQKALRHSREDAGFIRLIRTNEYE